MNSERGTERKMMIRPTGTIIAPPTPGTKRAIVNGISEVDAAHKMEPATKMPMARRKMVRAPKRSATQPQIGMKTPSPSTSLVTAIFNVTGSRPKALAISGIAVTMTLASTLSMNIAQATMRGAAKALMASDMENGRGSLRGGKLGLWHRYHRNDIAECRHWRHFTTIKPEENDDGPGRFAASRHAEDALRKVQGPLDRGPARSLSRVVRT